MVTMTPKQRILYWWEGEAEKALAMIRQEKLNGREEDAKKWRARYAECREILAGLEEHEYE